MKRDTVIARLKEAEAELRGQGVTHAALFGSVARGENGPDSDIDIMVDLDPDRPIGVFKYVGIVKSIEQLFNEKVDVSNHEGLKSYIRPHAERDAIYAF